MGWNSANDIVDSVIQQLVKGIENDEMQEAVAEQLLRTLIKKCQDGDWDTEDESLERFQHVPWVVRAFAACGVHTRVQTKVALMRLIRGVIDANVDSFYDLSDDFARALYAEKIADAVLPFLEMED